MYHLLFPFTSLLFLVLPFAGSAQSLLLKGQVKDKSTGMPLSWASITVFQKGKISGTVSNKDGGFLLQVPDETDSVKFSCIGYHSVVLGRQNTLLKDGLKEVLLEMHQEELSAVLFKNTRALEIIHRAIAATQKMAAGEAYENNFFYREIIKDHDNYFSVAEAVFQTQFFPAENESKIKLLKGRSKEDVSYTRLFEDYHPGGGPQALFKNSFANGLPDFLTPGKTAQFIYHKDSVISFDNRNVYVISFDQRPEVHEALDKGRLYIDTEDFAVLKYETESSPLGIKYVKNLTGTDKLFAKLLNIDFKRKSWSKRAAFQKYNGRLYLLHVFAEYKIDYRQPKKKLDLDLTITTEAAATNEAEPVVKEISGSEEWKHKNLVASLPTDFDTGFWGGSNIISPTEQVSAIVSSITERNKETTKEKTAGNWLYFHNDLFVAWQNNDSITLVPVAKSAWEDNETGGMLYQNFTGDFSFETELAISKRSDAGMEPDKGFQQAGIIIRDSSGAAENNIILCLGTGGNKNAKYFLRKTENGHSKGPVDKIDEMHRWLKVEKNGNSITAYIKTGALMQWEKIASYQFSWASKTLQAGLMVMAHFSGNGPRMKPDMKAVFSNIKIHIK